MLHDKLKVAIVSHDIVWGDKDENFITIAELLYKIDKDTDVVVLPELFCTGFFSTKEQLFNIAETNKETIIENVLRWSQFFGFAICGTFIAKHDEQYFNRAFFVEPSGDMSFYDKRHLYSDSLEKNCFNKGESNSLVIRYRGWNISMQICYDINFPVWCRNTNNKIDLLLVPANCPKERGYAWEQLLIARAIENQYYVVGANRSGQDDVGVYDNMSYIIDFEGKCISEESSISNKILYAQLDRARLNNHRTTYALTNDADLFELK